MPQGWRHDLIGIDPAEHWRPCTASPRSRTRARGSRSGSTTTSTPCRCPRTRRRTRRGRSWRPSPPRPQPGAARPDVHLHELPQPGLPRQGRGDGRHHLRRPHRDGHRRRLVRARVAGLRLRLPPRRRAPRPPRRGRRDLPPALDDRHRDARGRALPGRRRDRPPAAAAGGRHPVLDRGRRREEDAADRGGVRLLHELSGAPDEFAAKSACSRSTAGRPAPTSGASSAAPTTTHRRADGARGRGADPRPRGEVTPYLGAEKAASFVAEYRTENALAVARPSRSSSGSRG